MKRIHQQVLLGNKSDIGLDEMKPLPNLAVFVGGLLLADEVDYEINSRYDLEFKRQYAGETLQVFEL